MSLNITNIQKVGKKSELHMVRPSFDGSYLVTSGESDITYRTRLSPIPSCTCDWSKYHKDGEPVACSHVQATLAFVERQDGYKVKFFSQFENVDHHHRREVMLGNGVKATVRKTESKPKRRVNLNQLNDDLFG